MRRDDNRLYNRRERYIKRTAVVHKERLALLVIFIAAFFFSLLFLSIKANAGNFDNDNNSVKMYKSITIYSGDTFESIADKYMGDEYSSVNKYINEMLSINSMNSDTCLIPGNNIIVPYYECREALNPVIEISLAQ